MKQIDVREGARRQHRTISLFAVVQCWVRQLDGVAFERESLERLLGLRRFKDARVSWLREDLKEFFPFQVEFRGTSPAEPFHSLIVSRLSLDGYVPDGELETTVRIKRMDKRGPRIDMFAMWDVPAGVALGPRLESLVPFFSDAANFDERFLSSYLALLAQGQISPHSLPPLRSNV